MALKERIPLQQWAKANGISPPKAYQMAHAKKYKGVIVKIDGRWKVDIVAMDKIIEQSA